MAIDLREALGGVTIRASAPGRIDCGGGWDLKGPALASEAIDPSTVNLALDLRTTVVLEPAQDGNICMVVDASGTHRQDFPLPLVGPHALIFAIVSHFDVSGVKLTVSSDIPAQSGLGGSGVLAVTLIAALSKAMNMHDRRAELSPHRVALLAHHIEDGLQISHTGLQDQLAAAYGGVNQWIWQYSDFDVPYRRRVLLAFERFSELQRRILVAYSGETHDSKELISKWVQSFREPGHRTSWYGINQATHLFAEGIHVAQWDMVIEAMRREAALWDKICPKVWTPLTTAMRGAAEEHACGARFTGAGGGGCIWAMGAPDRIAHLRPVWEKMLERIPSGRLIPTDVTDVGLTVTV